MTINFESEGIDFILKEKGKIKKWIKVVALQHQKKLGDINFIFCSNQYILDLNKQYLNHNYFTDIITFDYCFKDIIEGDIFISIDTVLDNSVRFKTNFREELLRVIIHGILHLIGYSDKTSHQQKKMRELEDQSLSLFLDNAY